MPRILPTAVAITGVAAVAAAVVLRLAIFPSAAQLPDDTDTTRTYTGTLEAMLDASALASGDLANVLLTDIPVEVTRNVRVTGTEGDTADVTETASIAAADGTPILETTTEYLVDRKSMEEVGEREGLVIGWPIGAEATDTLGWSSDLQAPVDLVYERTEEHAGIEAMVFTADAQGTIVDPTILERLPASLPKAMLPTVATALDLPDAVASALPQLLETLPDQVDLTYTLDSQTTYWVDATSGIVIDVDRTERRLVGLDAEGVPAIPLADVFSISYTGEPVSVAQAVTDARDASSDLSLYGTTLPLVLLLGGLVMIGGALFLRGRREHETIDLTEDTTTPARERIDV